MQSQQKLTKFVPRDVYLISISFSWTSVRAMKYAILLPLAVGSTHSAWAAECGKNAGGWWAIGGGGTCEISAQSVTNNIGYSTALSVNGAANVTLEGNLTLDLTTVSGTAGHFQTRAVDIRGSASLISDHDLTIILRDDAAKKTVEKYGLMAYAGANVSIRDLDITLAHKNEREGFNFNLDGRYTYGVQVGFANPAADSAVGQTSRVTVRDLTVDLKSTPDSVSGIFNDGWYNMSAVRVIRHEDNNGSRAVFESTGKVTLTVEDLGAGDYANGIYVSGDGNEVILNDSEITVTGGANSSALRIGKGRTVGTGGGSIKSQGHMELDTTGSPNVATIRMLGRDSELNAAFAGSSSVVKSANTAVLYGRTDYLQNFDGEDQRVALRNAQITTTSPTAALIQVDQGITSSRFDLSGNSSSMVAADDGWLINVASGSELDATFSGQGTVAKGLTQVASGSSLNVTVQDGARWQLAPKTSLLADQTTTLSALTLNSGGTLDVASHLTGIGEAQYTVEVPVFINDAGIIDMNNASYADVLTIQGDYQGSGGTVRMNTLWNAPGDDAGANSFSDQIVITGQTVGGGSTRIVPVGFGGQEDFIDGDIAQVAQALNSIDVVITGGTVDAAFVGTGRTTGAAEAQLVRNGDNFRWTLAAKSPEPDPSPNPPPTPDPEPGPDPDEPAPAPDPTPDPSKPIFAPEVPGYVQMPRVNLEMGYTMLSTLHERVGEHQVLSSDKCDTCITTPSKQTWGRVLGRRLELDGKERLNFRADFYGLQIGHDFDIRHGADNGSRRHTGAYASYTHAKTDFYDEYRAVNGIVSSDKYSGKGSTDRVALGLYSTYYTDRGSYVDLVGELAYLRNKYHARNGTKVSQDGYSALASVEVGNPYRFRDSYWMFVPLGLLIFQHLNLKNFSDGLKSVEQGQTNAVRARIGVRLAYNKGGPQRRTDTFYVVGNIWHDLSSPDSVKIGRDKLREKYNRTWGELGLGVQMPVGRHSHLYADARYEHAFSNERRMGYRGTVGFKYHW